MPPNDGSGVPQNFPRRARIMVVPGTKVQKCRRVCACVVENTAYDARKTACSGERLAKEHGHDEHATNLNHVGTFGSGSFGLHRRLWRKLGRWVDRARDCRKRCWGHGCGQRGGIGREPAGQRNGRRRHRRNEAGCVRGFRRIWRHSRLGNRGIEHGRHGRFGNRRIEHRRHGGRRRNWNRRNWNGWRWRDRNGWRWWIVDGRSGGRWGNRRHGDRRKRRRIALRSVRRRGGMHDGRLRRRGMQAHDRTEQRSDGMSARDGVRSEKRLRAGANLRNDSAVPAAAWNRSMQDGDRLQHGASAVRIRLARQRQGRQSPAGLRRRGLRRQRRSEGTREDRGVRRQGQRLQRRDR